MAYSLDLRRKEVNYIHHGHSQREAAKVFDISLSPVNDWHQKYEKTGEIERTPYRRGYIKMNPEELKAYVSEHPDAYLKEIEEVSGCTDTGCQHNYGQLTKQQDKPS